MPLDASPRVVSLKRWLQAAFTGFAVSLLLAVAMSIWPLVSHYRAAERNLRGMEAYGLLLTAANNLSSERGPSNLLMSIEPGSDGAALERLQTFRERTDRSLAALYDLDRSWGEARFFDILSASVRATQNDLAEARAEVDRIAALPNAQRSQGNVRNAVDGMIAVVDRYQPLINSSARMLGRLDSQIGGAALTAQSVSDLREFGGRIASVIVPSIARRQPLTPEVIERFHVAEGRLWELQRLLESQSLLNEGPVFRSISEDVRGRFFAQGLGLLKRLVEQGRAGGDYTLSVSDLTATYVPTLKPLEDLRTLYLTGMVDEFRAQSRAAFQQVVLTCIAAALFLAMVFWLLNSVRRKILTPLLSARDMIVSLAANQTIQNQTEAPEAISEMRTLFSAVSVLAEQTSERRLLLEQFRVQAETDRLTKLANRCRFETLAAHRLQTAQVGRLGVLLFDLDLFKNVNDTFGHQAGDEVLFKVARRLEALETECILFARIGGDEFAVLCDGLDERDQMDLAGRIVKLLSRPFEVKGGIARIGSSVGVAVLRDHGTTLATLCHQADMALYEAKAQGRNRLCLFDERMERAFHARSVEQEQRLDPAA